MSDLYLTLNDKGQHQAVRLVNGRYSLAVGPGWDTPREALAYLAQLRETPSVPPLRSGQTDIEDTSHAARSGSAEGSPLPSVDDAADPLPPPAAGLVAAGGVLSLDL